MNESLATLWSHNQTLSLVVWSLLLIVIGYLGREQAHHIFKHAGGGLVRLFRLMALGFAKAELKLTNRNRDLLIAAGENQAEKSIEREFSRLANIIKRDLSEYPSLHREIAEAIEKIEIDYQRSALSAPLPPAWGDVVETIAKLPTNGDPTVRKILENIKTAVEDSHRQILKSFKQSSAESHRLLASMQPQWRTIDAKLEKVQQNIGRLDRCAEQIDEQIADYAEILHQKKSAVDKLSQSALTQFFIAGLVLVIAILGGLINFQLIAMPMSEMVGGTSYIGTMKTSDVAAMVIILIEVAMGLFLLESLRITHLFPIIGSMDDRMRRRMMYITLAILTILASIEASLAYMRDLLALDKELLQQSLVQAQSSAELMNAHFRWIPSVGQMVMGFILPFALAFIAIPLESFIHALRIVIGLVAVGVCRVCRIFSIMLAGLFRQLTKVLINLFDFIIMLPILIERIVVANSKARRISNERIRNDATTSEH